MLDNPTHKRALRLLSGPDGQRLEHGTAEACSREGIRCVYGVRAKLLVEFFMEGDTIRKKHSPAQDKHEHGWAWCLRSCDLISWSPLHRRKVEHGKFSTPLGIGCHFFLRHREREGA